MIHAVARKLHRLKTLRRLAKRLCRRWVLTQPFHGGVIALNAVSHSWAWTGDYTYETFDRTVQDRLLALSRARPKFLDVGANVGAMTLSVLLRNPTARAVAVEPGEEAAALLRRSLRLNRLQARSELLMAAASGGERRLGFDPAGSVSGHVATGGHAVPALAIADLIQHASGENLLVKIDVEGYETSLLRTLAHWPIFPGSCAVIELHPRGFNIHGDPLACLRMIEAQPHVSITALGGMRLPGVAQDDFTQIELHWI